MNYCVVLCYRTERIQNVTKLRFTWYCIKYKGIHRRSILLQFEQTKNGCRKLRRQSGSIVRFECFSGSKSSNMLYAFVHDYFSCVNSKLLTTCVSHRSPCGLANSRLPRVNRRFRRIALAKRSQPRGQEECIRVSVWGKGFCLLFRSDFVVSRFSGPINNQPHLLLLLLAVVFLCVNGFQRISNDYCDSRHRQGSSFYDIAGDNNKGRKKLPLRSRRTKRRGGLCRRVNVAKYYEDSNLQPFYSACGRWSVKADGFAYL